MDGWVGGWVDERLMEGWVNVCVRAWIDVRRDEQMNIWIDTEIKRTDGERHRSKNTAN